MQREIFNRISMKLLMRQHGSYTKTCFWRTYLNEDTDLATLIPASFSLFSTGFSVLYHSSEASAASLELLLELECIACVACMWLQGCLWQCKSNEQDAKSCVTTAKSVLPVHGPGFGKELLKPHQGVQPGAQVRVNILHRYRNEVKAVVLKNVTSRGSNIILKNFIQCLWFQETSVEKMKWIFKITIKHI